MYDLAEHARGRAALAPLDIPAAAPQRTENTRKEVGVMANGVVELALSQADKNDITWYVIMAAVFIVGVVFAFRSN